MATVFIKQSIGLNPFSSRRDWSVLACILAGLLIAAALLLLVSRFPHAASAALFGALGGMLPSLGLTLPVRGTVAAASEAAFLGRVAQYGFVAAGETPDGQLYTYNSRHRWMRWDSNRVLIKRAANGDLQVTVPLSFYRQLKRHHS